MCRVGDTLLENLNSNDTEITILGRNIAVD